MPHRSPPRPAHLNPPSPSRLIDSLPVPSPCPPCLAFLKFPRLLKFAHILSTPFLHCPSSESLSLPPQFIIFSVARACVHPIRVHALSLPPPLPPHLCAGMLCDLLWSDPEADISGWAENDRGVSYTFGADVVSKFLQKHDYDLIVRAHQVVEDGYEFFADRQLVTLFSAPNYCGEFDNVRA